MSIRPTLKELASLTGVSISTVSRALSNPEAVKYTTRIKIQQALEEYSNTKTKQHKGLIGVIVPDLENPFFSMMFSGIDEAALSTDMLLLVANSRGSALKEEQLLKRFLEQKVDGILLITTGQKPSTLLEDIVKENIVPIVFLDREPEFENINSVSTDNRGGMYQATKYLITLGHKDILFLGGRKDISTSRERLLGYQDAIKDLSTIKEEDRVRYADFSKQKAYDLILSLLENKELDKFTAIAAASDSMALGAIEALKEKNYKKLSIIGFDDVSAAEASGLTTIHQPFKEMGQSALFQLTAMITNPKGERKKIYLTPNIVFRTSCSINLR